MDSKRKVSRINNLSIKWKLNVAVYCRVSTTHAEQIESLSNQIEYYRQMVSNHIDWVLVDIYADIQSGKSTSIRPQFQRMLENCSNNKIDLIITKSISRFGRNTADTLDVIHKLRLLNVDLFLKLKTYEFLKQAKHFYYQFLEQ